MQSHKSGRTKTYVACALTLLASTAWADGRLHNLKAVQDGAAYQGFIVKYRDGSAEYTNSQALLSTINAATDNLKKSNAVDISAKGNPNRPFGLEHVRRIATGGNLIHPSRKISRDEGASIMRQLAAGANVEYVEPNLINYTTAVPNDPMYSSQWGYGVNGIRAEQAWDKSNGTGIIVAVLDTGITSHPDLNANIVPGYDFVSDATNAADGNGRDSNPADMGNSCATNWHGTHTAGTIAAVSNNTTGVAGVAFGAKVMPVRVLGTCGGTVADIADAITWSSGGAVAGVTTLTPATTAKVISMSLGGAFACPASYQTVIDGAISRGTSVVAAAGNSNTDVANFSPASCNGVIAVAAVDSTGARASFSNFGTRIDVSAPGVNVLSTWNAGTTAVGAPTYANMNGTSMAAPHVAGTVALIQARRKATGLALYSPAEVTQVLKGMARTLPGACTGGCGAGIIDAGASVSVALANSVPVGKMTDPTGRMTTVIFQRTAATAASSFTDFQIDVPEDYAVVGGGVQGAEFPQGHLLTASYPNAARNGWLVSTKDHLVSNPAQIVGWAIGMKINNMTRATLLSNLSYKEITSATSATPSASAAMDFGYLLLGGGFKVGPNAAGNLAVSSYPQYPGSQYLWTVQSKEHGTPSPATITAYGIGMKWTLSDGSSMTTSTNSSAVSPVTSHPSATAVLSPQFGYVITGCGAVVNWANPGNLLWKAKPLVNAGVGNCEVASKDHFYSSPASIQGFALGVKFN
jgi:serine protease